MCGIFGVVGDIGDRELDLFMDLAMANQDRGQVAHGLYLEDQVIKGLGLFDPYMVLSCLKRKPRHVLLGHTRAPTGGAPVDEENNHPFHAGGYWLAHNGILINHKELREKLPFVPSHIKTDSIVILYSIVSLQLSGMEAENAILTTCERVKGSFACWLWDEIRLRLFLFRCIAPLFVRWEKEVGAFSSVPFKGSKVLRQGSLLELASGVTKPRIFERAFKYYSPYDDIAE